MNIDLYRAARAIFASLLLAVVSWFVIDFPILQIALAIGFVAYGACLWRWPWLWLVMVPALLPLFDLAPWSGRFFFEEFDALVLLTAAVLRLRDFQTGSVAPLGRELKFALVLLIISYLVSAVIRLWPPIAITADSFADYTSPYNALRVGKGFVWALLLLQPLREGATRYANTRWLLALGFLSGLIGVSLVSFYERWLFTGILTWVTTYRTTASFSSMHTGDGPIDVWLAMTMPFLALLYVHRRWLMLAPLTLALALLSTYALVVTQSRGPVIAVILAYLVGLLALLATRAHRRRVGGALLLSAAAGLVIATAGLPLFMQSSFGERFTQTSADALFRLGHWKNSLALRDTSAFTETFGMGLGSFPAVHQQRSTREPRATRYQFVSSGATHFLTLWSGESLYMGQDVTATQNSVYRFSAKARSASNHSGLTVSWCELWMLSSQACTWDSFTLSGPANQWQSLSRTIFTKEVGSGRRVAGLFFEKPTRFTFFVGDAPETGIDVTDFSLKDAQGRELLRNGDFARGSDNWFWAVDDHLQWHTKNLAVNILFDQGWLGLLAVGTLVGLTLWSLGRQIVSGDQLAAIYLASMTGFLVVGVTVSTFDQPRLALAFYLMCFASLIPWAVTSKKALSLPTA